MSEQEQERPYAAMVVHPSDLEEARAVARMFRAVGIMREAFSSVHDARAWEHHQEELWESEKRRRERRSG